MDGKKKGAPKMTDEERAKLVKKLDDEMADYLAELEKKAAAREGPSYKEGWKEETWEQEMESHPFFASNDESLLEDASKGELSPLIEGLQQLKYSPDENTADELAINYKEDGNFQFKLKKYRLAIAAYTEGIKCKSSDELVQVQLMTNRAAAQFHLGNFRSSFNDCVLATQLKAGHFKAVKRGALCCYELKRFDDCIRWCEKAKAIEANDPDIANLHEKAKSERKEFERNVRKEATRKKKKKNQDIKLIKALISKNVKLKDVDWNKVDVDKEEHVHEIIEKKLTPVLQAASAKRVHFSQENDKALVWPVLFMYPEYGETDLIEEFEETGQCFSDHLQAMFGHGIERPNWDISNKYHPERIKVYFEDRVTNPDKVALKAIKDTNMTLNQVLSDPLYEVINGLPTFIILVEKSHYETFMIKSYENPHLK